jgi:two-component system, sensor histidine kinase PdtaS
MNRAVAIFLLLSLAVTSKGQTASADVTVRNYTPAQRRLLLMNTFQFINLIVPGQIDGDSMLAIAVQLTGIPFSPYEDEKVNSVGERETKRLLDRAAVFLFRPGNRRMDLDSAGQFIAAAERFSTNEPDAKWETERRLLAGELARQRGDTIKSRQIYTELVSKGEATHDTILLARGYEKLAGLLSSGDSMKLVLYRRSLRLYQLQSNREKEMELLGNVAFSNFPLDFVLVDSALRQILILQQQTGFRHNLFTNYLLAYASLPTTKYVDALNYAKAALANFEWSGMRALSAPFFTRMGAVYLGLGNDEKKLYWYKRALATRTHETRLFWYKSLIYVTETLRDLGKPAECLDTIQLVTAEYPPISVWEKMMLLMDKGSAFELLNKPGSADTCYTAIYTLMTHSLNADPHDEFAHNFNIIGSFYATRGDLKKARQFQKLGDKGLSKTNISDEINKYLLAYQIDSAEHRYQKALQDHIQYTRCVDSSISINERDKANQLTLRYETAKRDKDLAVMKQHDATQLAELQQTRLIRNIMIIGSGCLMVVAGLCFSQFKSKQRANRVINKKNALLQQLVDEKEWLLKEIHHRVKNNLHTVICLLESQARHLEDDALKAIEVSQNRIYAMSLIHQKLYQSDDMKVIDMSVYIPDLVGYLDNCFGAKGRIQFQLEIEPIKLGVAQALPVGLIINEAVTNSIKYAFPAQRRGLIRIAMKQGHDGISLTLADNGIGMNIDAASRDPASMGLKLIYGLADDLNAALSLSGAGGTSLKMLFPLDRWNQHDFPILEEKEAS